MDDSKTNRDNRNRPTWSEPSAWGAGQHPAPQHRPPHGHGRHGPPHHLHGHHHPHDHSPISNGFAENAGNTLAKLLPDEFVSGLLRAISYGPPEMKSIFKVQVATIAHEIQKLEHAGKPLPQFTKEQLTQGDAAFSVLVAVVPELELSRCIGDLFASPDEVTAIAYLILLGLQLSSHAGMETSEGQLDE